MTTITANELKTKGISALEPIIKDHKAAMITIHGKMRYVVMDIQTYNYLRECELEAALMETRRDLKNKDVFEESVADHIKRIINEV